VLTKILFVGDIVGEPGRRAVQHLLPAIVERHGIDFVIANGENAAGGSGINVALARKFFDLGIHVITLGDHCFRRTEITALMETEPNILRPANFPEEAAGRGWTIVRRDGLPAVAVINLLGRIFMDPAECPFHAATSALYSITGEAKVIIVDFHAEATSEKVAAARYLDGKVSAVIGTHTHVPTADETIFPGGTAFICDVGMTGPHESIIGRKIEAVLKKLTTQMPAPFDVAEGDVRLNAVIITVDSDTGRAQGIERLCVKMP